MKTSTKNTGENSQKALEVLKIPVIMDLTGSGTDAEIRSYNQSGLTLEL